MTAPFGSVLYRFDLAGDANPQMPMRVLGLFAQRDVVTRRVTITHVEEGDMLDIMIEVELQPDVAAILLEKIRSMVLVGTVMLKLAMPGQWKAP